MINLTLKVIKFFKNFENDKDIKNFIKINKKNFKNTSNIETNEIVLTELTNMQSSIIAISYYLRFFLNKKKYIIIAYNPFKLNLKNSISYKIQKFLNSNLFKIYKSMNVSQFMEINLFKIKKKIKINEIYNIYKSINSKQKLENLELDNILIGDLVYDHYLVFYKEPTIDLNSKKFKNFFFESIYTFYYWKLFIENNNIKAINITHCCYLNGIISRIASKKKIDVYLFSSKSVFHISENFPFAWKSYKIEKNYFNKLSIDKRKLLILSAQNQIDKRFKGEIGIDMSYSQKSAFSKSTSKNVIKKSDNLKILICSHCFFDSVHAYGNNLFTDFYEWMECLGKLSTQTNYDWYIKTHPDIIPYSYDIVKKFSQKYNKIKLLDKGTSHLQIVNEGINFVLTVYGTVGFEYAMLGIPVINASLNNPHSDYSFNIHPKSVSEYITILKNLEDIDLVINKEDILEYYAVRNILNYTDWLFTNHSKMINDLGGYKGQFSNKVYQYWIEGKNSNLDKEICDNLSDFIYKNQYKLTNLKT